MTTTDRRRFLLSLAGIAPAAWLAPATFASAGSPGRVLVNVMLFGGADFRFLVMPPPDYDPAYTALLWEARRLLYNESYADYAAVYDAEYTSVVDPRSSATVGIHKSAAWLADRFSEGDVAIVANVFGSTNRRHDHSQLIVHAGDSTTGVAETDRDGWGGRFVDSVSDASRSVVVSPDVSLVTLGTDPANRLENSVHAPDIRRASLPVAGSATDPASALTRAIESYYLGRRTEATAEHAPDWPFAGYFANYDGLRRFGDAIDAQLAGVSMPAPLAGLSLDNAVFAQQCRNLHDAWVCRSVLNLRFLSMSYGGFDSHRDQNNALRSRFSDLFGAAGGLAALYATEPGPSSEVVFHFATDFGRQLRANGGLGTDHGHGNYSLLLGPAVNGGLYGEPFPTRERLPDPDDGRQRSPLEIEGSDIAGLTSVERVLYELCDWASPGSGDAVFPSAASSPLEAGVSLDDLFTV